MKKVKILISVLLLSSVFVPMSHLSAAPIPPKDNQTATKEAKSEFLVKDSKIELNSKWDPASNFLSATDENGKNLAWKDISKKVEITGNVNTEKIGVNKITYSFNGLKKTANVEVVEKLIDELPEVKELKVKNIEIPLGQAFEPSEMFEGAVKKDDTILGWKEMSPFIKVTSKVDTNLIGTYEVTFTYNKLVQTGTVKVVEAKITPLELIVFSNKIKVGDNWSPEMNFDSVTLSDGNKLLWQDVIKEIVVSGEVNTNEAGVYPITYNYRDITAGAVVTVEATEIIKVQEVLVKDSELPVGADWNVQDNFKHIKMSDGTKRSWEDIKNELLVLGEVNTQIPGDYQIQYIYSGQIGIATIKVREREVIKVQKLTVKDSTLNVGSKWQAKDNFIKVELTDGTSLLWKDIKDKVIVSGTVNSSQSGVYKITYTYEDVSETAIVTVKELEQVKPQAIKTKDSTLNVGDKWEAKDNFISVMFSDGTELPWSEVKQKLKITDNVDTKKVNTYTVTYTYEDISQVATVSVKEKEVGVKEISVKNTNLPIGQKWEAKDNFNFVLLTDGSKLVWKDVADKIVVTGNVDSNIPGEYQVTYNYLQKTATATITVKEMEVLKTQEISVKNTEIKQNTKWEAKDNFNHILLTNGTKLTWLDAQKEIKVSGTVDTTKLGTYKVTYGYGDKLATAEIKVVADAKKVVPVKPKGKLPQTGDVISWPLISFGLLVIVATFGVIWLELRKEEE